ncbi:MAG: hypothetical protein Q4C10_07725 [Clostridia bacterium]|nr:hypothetical protein [Clostridia bacterium]
MKLFALCLAALLVVTPALGESNHEDGIAGLDLSALEEYAKQTGVGDAKALLERILRGELTLDRVHGKQIAGRLARGLRSEFTDLLRTVALPALACLALRAFPGRRKNWSRAAELVCRAACAMALIERYALAAQSADRALERALGFVRAAAPVLSSLLALGGSPAEAMLAPASAVCVDWVEGLLRDCGLPMCALAAVVAASGDLSDRFRLSRLFEWFKRCVVWGTGALLAGFTGLMSLEGLLASAQETTVNRAARQALTGLVPIIGGSLSESAASLTAGFGAIRGAIGMTGALVLLMGCGGPLLGLLIKAISVKLAAAVLEPVSERGLSEMLSHFGDLMEMLLAIGIGGAALALLLTGACFAAAGALC